MRPGAESGLRRRGAPDRRQGPPREAARLSQAWQRDPPCDCDGSSHVADELDATLPCRRLLAGIAFSAAAPHGRDERPPDGALLRPAACVASRDDVQSKGTFESSGTSGRLMEYGVCRGAKPLCRESEGVPSDMISSPFLARKGVRGMVERVFQPASTSGGIVAAAPSDPTWPAGNAVQGSPPATTPTPRRSAVGGDMPTLR